MAVQVANSDTELVSRATFEQALPELRSEIHRYCSRMTGSVIDGEDVLQIAFMKAFEALKRGDAVINLRAWLFRIAHNATLDYLRTRKRERALLGATLPAPEAHTDDVERSEVAGSLRPFLALLMLFTLRQICQGLSPLPAPTGMIWHHPGFPSLLVTYQVANDFFFSGHTAIATIGAIEMGRIGRRWWLPAVLLLLFEATTVIVLRAHYTMDVYTGMISALLVAIVAARVAPTIDRWLSASPSVTPTTAP